ncbi:MAG: ribonuclease P protein subunit [Candidatus Woesearchaeota archaeon]
MKQELIGVWIRVVESANKSNIGLDGKVIDETKNMLTLQTRKGKKNLIKSQNVIEFRMGNKKIRINGKLLQARPEERIKK